MAKYEMQVNRSGAMEQKAMLTLRDIYLAPYMQLATALIGKQRRAGGNMFRHQLDTMTILIDYGYIDSVLLKASCIHDVVEDIPGFDTNSIINVDEEGEDVYRLVLEVTRRKEEDKQKKNENDDLDEWLKHAEEKENEQNGLHFVF